MMTKEQWLDWLYLKESCFTTIDMRDREKIYDKITEERSELQSRVTELGLNDQQLTTRILELQGHLKDGRDYAMKQDKQINELKAENGLLEHQLKIMGDRSCNTCKYKRWRSYMGPCVSCVNQDKWKGR